MAGILSRWITTKRRRMASTALTFLVGLGLLMPLSAQQQGPIGPPAGMPSPPSDAKPKSTPGTPPDATTKGAPSAISNEPPSIPIEQIIQRFAAREAEFKAERENYTYTQTFVFQTLDDSDRVDGEYRRTSDVLFTEGGKRYEKDTYAPVPSLERLSLTQEDFYDLEHLYPFVLTTPELPKYDVKYVGREPLDELSTYVFEVRPKTMEKNQRYFQGRIWVDDKDYQIVKSFGKPVGYVKKRSGGDDAFPNFETFRENIEGDYWFPTYTRANETLQFKHAEPVRIRMTVRYENYKRFGVTVKIGKPTKNDDKP